jgi:hypothetical protein
MPVVSATQEEEVGGSQFKVSLGRDHNLKNKLKAEGLGGEGVGMAQMVE